MSYRIDEIEGIGKTYAGKLAAAEIRRTDDLLEKCGSAAGRREVARTTGLSEAQLLEWTNMADLMRISGVGEEYSELLEAAGVDTVKELKQRRPDPRFPTRWIRVDWRRAAMRSLPARWTTTGSGARQRGVS